MQQRLSQGQWRYATEVVAFTVVVHYKKWRISAPQADRGKGFATGSPMTWHIANIGTMGRLHEE